MPYFTEAEKARLHNKLLTVWGISDQEFNQLFAPDQGITAYSAFAWIAQRCPDFNEVRRLLTEASELRHRTRDVKHTVGFTLSDARKVRENMEAVWDANTAGSARRGHRAGRRSSRRAVRTRAQESSARRGVRTRARQGSSRRGVRTRARPNSPAPQLSRPAKIRQKQPTTNGAQLPEDKPDGEKQGEEEAGSEQQEENEDHKKYMSDQDRMDLNIAAPVEGDPDRETTELDKYDDEDNAAMDIDIGDPNNNMDIDSGVPPCLIQPREWLDFTSLNQLLKMVTAGRPAILVVPIGKEQEITASDLIERPGIEIILLPLQVDFKRWWLAAIPFGKLTQVAAPARRFAPLHLIKIYRSSGDEETREGTVKTVVKGFLARIHASWPEQSHGQSPVVGDFALAWERCLTPGSEQQYDNGIIAVMAAMHLVADKELPNKTDLTAWRRLFCFLCSEEVEGIESLFPTLAKPLTPGEADYETPREHILGVQEYLQALTTYHHAREQAFVTHLQIQSILGWYESDLDLKIGKRRSLVDATLVLIKADEEGTDFARNVDQTDMIRHRHNSYCKELAQLGDLLVRIKRCRKVAYESLKTIPCRVICSKVPEQEEGALNLVFRLGI